MDNFDKKLYHDLNLGIEIPNEFTNTIKQSLNNDKIKKKVTHYSFVKIVATACACLIMTIGVVYASTEIVKNIWRKPRKTVGFALEGSDRLITQEEKTNCMTEEEATNKFRNILTKFGYDNEIIKSANLDGNLDSYELDWRFKTESGILVGFDAKEEKFLDIFFGNVFHKDIENYRTTAQEAEKTARSLCKKYGYDVTEYSNVKVTSNCNSDDKSYIYYVTFTKEYDGYLNNYERIYIGFIPEINEIESFAIYDFKYDNNPVEIEKEEAIKTALDAENGIKHEYEIECTKAELGIVRMNGDAYLRTTDYKQYIQQKQQINSSLNDYVEYQTDKPNRKAWKITVESKEENDKNVSYEYYVDATTGEIIGGRTNIIRLTSER